MDGVWKWGGLLLLSSAMISGWWLDRSYDPPAKPQPLVEAEVEPEIPLDEHQRSLARVYCMSGLKQVLHDPGSAEWGAFSGNFYGSWRAQNEADGWLTVWPTFRARNGFGGLVLTSWRCRVRMSGETLVEFGALEQL